MEKTYLKNFILCVKKMHNKEMTAERIYFALQDFLSTYIFKTPNTNIEK